MNKLYIFIGILAIIILGLLGVLFLMQKPASAPVPVVKQDIEVFSPKPNEVVSSPLKITGIVRGNGWNGFEGQVGGVTLKDANGNDLAQGPLTTTTDWMQLPTNFETMLTFALPATDTGNLVFHNENPSGDLAKDKTFTLPIKLK